MMQRFHFERIALFTCWLAAASLLGSERPDQRPPWQGQSKIRPSETGRLTEADVVGPDGIVYPNWTRTGVQGGIPRIEPAATIEEFGGQADDDQDDSGALDRACQAVGKKGGGAVLLGQGTYHLDWPVTVRHDRVVIRGRGPDKTKIIFRYALPADGIRFYGLKPGNRIGRNSQITLHCRPAKLETMTIEVDGRTVHEWKRGPHAGNTFATSVAGRAIVGRVPDGRHTLRGTVTRTAPHGIPRSRAAGLEVRAVGGPLAGAILFAGKGYAGPPIAGSRWTSWRSHPDAQTVADLAPGDRIHLEAPATSGNGRACCAPASGAGIGVRSPGGKGRRPAIAVSQQSMTFPPSTVRLCAGPAHPAMRRGRSLFGADRGPLDQRRVVEPRLELLGAGRDGQKWPVSRVCAAPWGCEIRDCVFDDAWFKGGGTACAGWDYCWDCLMENVDVQIPPRPALPMAASGSVVRKSCFTKAMPSGTRLDPRELDRRVRGGVGGGAAYGFGMWASPPEDTAHRPNGPRSGLQLRHSVAQDQPVDGQDE